MKVSEVMTPQVTAVSPEASVREAARLMRELDTGPLPVCEGGRLLGMVPPRDLAVRATAEGRDAESTLVMDVMTSDLLCCYAEDELEHAERLMRESRLARLVVLDQDRRPVGVVTLADLARGAGLHPQT